MMKKSLIGTTIVVVISLIALSVSGLAVAQTAPSPYPINAYLYETLTSSSNLGGGGYIGNNSSGILPTTFIIYYYGVGNSTITLKNNGTVLYSATFFKDGNHQINLTSGVYHLTFTVTSVYGSTVLQQKGYFGITIYSTRQYISYVNSIQQKQISFTLTPTLLAEYILGFVILSITFALMSSYISFRIDWEINMRNVTKEVKN